MTLGLLVLGGVACGGDSLALIGDAAVVSGEILQDASARVADSAQAQDSGPTERSEACQVMGQDSAGQDRYYARFDVDYRTVAGAWVCEPSVAVPVFGIPPVECSVARTLVAGGAVWVECGAAPNHWAEARLTLL